MDWTLIDGFLARDWQLPARSLGHQVLKRHFTIGEIPNRPVVGRWNPDGVLIADHLADHRAGYAEVFRESGRPPVFGIQPILDVHSRTLTHLKRGGQGFPQSDALNMPTVVKSYRRQRFLELLKGPFKGDRAAFATASGLTNGRITQLLDPNEPFGDTAARRLIERLGLPADYFDPPMAGQTPSPAGLAVGATYDKMKPEQQKLFLKLLEASFGALEEDRPREFGHSDAMDIELELPPVEEDKKRGEEKKRDK